MQSPVIFGLLVFVHLAVGGPVLNHSANKDLKAYTLFPGVGYYLYEPLFSFNWTSAFEHCIDHGGLLAVPNSDAEAEVFQTLIAKIEPVFQDTVYVGFHDRFVIGEYETIHDKPLAQSGYTRWASGVPNVSQNLRCGGFSKDGGLVNVDCSAASEILLLCEQPLWADYERFEGVPSFYKLHVKPKNWTEAWRTCREEESHLAVINSPEEYALLQALLKIHPNIPEADTNLYAWVGVHADYAYNKFRTVVGTSLEESGYATWETGYPELTVNFNTHVALKRDNGNLILYPSLSELAFFCEHE